MVAEAPLDLSEEMAQGQPHGSERGQPQPVQAEQGRRQRTDMGHRLRWDVLGTERRHSWLKGSRQ